MRWILFAVILMVACDEPPALTGISDERFIETVAELRRAADAAAGDTAVFQAERERILREQQVTEDDLRAYVETHSTNLPHMAAIWDSVHARVGPEGIR